MKYFFSKTNRRVLIYLAALLAVSCVRTSAQPTPSTSDDFDKAAYARIVARCKADLGHRSGVQDISVLRMEPRTWNDESLGMPRVGKTYRRKKTPGLLITLKAGGISYVYTVGKSKFRYGGPADLWSHSMLYTVAMPNDPNLNCSLYQCSLMGTNTTLVAGGVSDFYPQDNQAVVFKSRTSRSAFDLWYAKADGTMKARKLCSAFDFGEAAVDPSQSAWAGFIRESIADVWSVAVGDLQQSGSEARIIPLPEGTVPGQIAWSGNLIMILTSTKGHSQCLQIPYTAGDFEWKPAFSYRFPPKTSLTLKDGRRVDIVSTTSAGKPSVGVTLIRQEGVREEKGRIEDFILDGWDIIGQSAFLWGRHNSTTGCYIVNISSGEVINCLSVGVESVKPFRCAPCGTPFEGTRSPAAETSD